MVVGVDAAVWVEVWVSVVLAGRLVVVSCCVDCCWVVEDDVMEVVSEVEESVVADDEEEAMLELLIFATVMTMVNEGGKIERTYRRWWNC